MVPKLEDFRVCIVPAKGEMLRISMSKFRPEKSSDPAHKVFYSCMLGFRSPPNRFASLFLGAYRASLIAERYLQFRFSRGERIFCTLGRWCRRFSFSTFRTAFRLGAIRP